MYIIVDFAHNTYGNITCKINDYFLNINMLVDIICILSMALLHHEITQCWLLLSKSTANVNRQVPPWLFLYFFLSRLSLPK